MPIYTFRCEEHGDVDAFRSMDEAHLRERCGTCGLEMARVFHAPRFIEDRSRFQRNPRTGQDFSDVLGQPYPKTRQERDRIYAEKGIEPVAVSDMPKDWQFAVDYHNARKNGAPELSKKELDAALTPPDLSSVKSVAQQLKESNVKINV